MASQMTPTTADPAELKRELVAVTRELALQRLHRDRSDDPDKADVLEKFLAVKQVLKAHPFSGINRKVQLKPTAWATH